MSDVVRMLDRAPIVVDNEADLFKWLDTWLEPLRAGDYGEFRSLVVVLESRDGRLATLSQSIGLMDKLRLAGLLQATAHRVLDGSASIEGLRR